MNLKITAFLVCLMLIVAGCAPVVITATRPMSTQMPTANIPSLVPSMTATIPTVELQAYAFPQSIDPARQYLFYLHGKIIEDQGIHAVSVEFGEYEYEAILNKLQSSGFVVISERRPKDTDVDKYARKIVEVVTLLLKANVPPEQITVVGASKGSNIAATVSNLFKNEKINFVLLGSCAPEVVAQWKLDQIYFYGNVLSIYDSVDDLSGSCLELFVLSKGKGIARYNEIVLHIGTGHGILYKPLDDWIIPTKQWAMAGKQP